MRFATSVVLAVLLLALPVGCILASSPAHACCPEHKPDTNASLKCPYDVFDGATTAHLLAPVAVLPAQTVTLLPQMRPPELAGAPIVLEDGGDLLLLNRILRI